MHSTKAQIRKIFLAETKKNICDIKANITSKDHKNVHKKLRSIAGTAQTMGMENLGALCAGLADYEEKRSLKDPPKDSSYALLFEGLTHIDFYVSKIEKGLTGYTEFSGFLAKLEDDAHK